MVEENRSTLVGGLWFFSSLVLMALFISAAAQKELTTGHIVLAGVILALVVIATPLLLRWQTKQTQQEKSKREDIDNLLSNLSDTELIALKRRLSQIDEDDMPLSDYIDDDGELAWHR